MKILVVDDKRESLYLLKTLLEGYGFQVLVAGNGQEALGIVRSQGTDMVISDILMPVMDGFRLCREMKTDEKLKGIPFVFYTATYTEARDEELALSLGAERFIRKPEEPETFVQIIQEVIHEAQSGKLTPSTLPPDDGKDVIELYNERLVKKLEDKILQLRGEILERKRAEKRFLKSEEKFRQLAENIRDVFYINDPTRARMIYVSPAYEEIWGRTCESLYKNPLSFLDAVHPEDRDRVADSFVKERQGTPVQIHYRITRPDGSTRWIKSRAYPVLDHDGKFIRIVGISEDVTEKVLAEQEIIRSEEKYRSLFDDAPIMYVITRNEERIPFVHDVNRFFLAKTGYTREETIGRPLAKFYSEESARELLEGGGYQRTLNGTLTEEDRQIVTRSGRIIDTLLHAIPVKDETGRVFGTRCAYIDISARKAAEKARRQSEEEKRQLEDQLRQAQRMEALGTLAGGVAHDFNNLLTAIIGHSDILLIDLDEKHPLYHDIMEIRQAGQRAASLTRQLLAFSRRQPIQPSIHDLNRILSSLEKMLKRLIGEQIQLTSDLSPGLRTTLVDAGQIEQVVINLSVNARDAMPNGGNLHFSTQNIDLGTDFFRERGLKAWPGPYILMKVRDTGVGMEAGTMERIFDPFFTTKGPRKGTGLGLSTVYGIVKQSNGYIFVESEPGRGTTFVIYLPVTEKAEEIEAAKIDKQRITGGKETILVIEDDERLRRMIVEILDRQGYRVLTAEDCETALDVSKGYDGDIHLLLTDVIMPGVSGKEMADILLQERPQIRVLFMSGYMDDSIARYGVLKPGIHFIAKPFSVRDLARRVRDVLDGR